MKTEERIASILINDMKNKNIITRSEFSRYLPLFDNRIISNNEYQEEELKKLIEEYRLRFNLHLPITIISDDRKTVIETRPPMFIQIPSLNRNIKKASELVSTYNNIMTNDAQPKAKKQAIGEVLHQAVHMSIENDKKYKDDKSKAVNMMDNKQGSTQPVTEKKVTEGFEWE